MRTIKLCRGLGEEGKSHCVVAATSIVAGEVFSDRPTCVCPTIIGALVATNDSYGEGTVADAKREDALSHLPWLIIGTNMEAKGAATYYKHVAAKVEVMEERLKLLLSAANEAIKESGVLLLPSPFADELRNHIYDAEHRQGQGLTAADIHEIAHNRREAPAICSYRHTSRDYAYVFVNIDKALNRYWEVKHNAIRTCPDDWRRKLITLIEDELIPIHTTMTIEPTYDFSGLFTREEVEA